MLKLDGELSPETPINASICRFRWVNISQLPQVQHEHTIKIFDSINKSKVITFEVPLDLSASGLV